MTIGVKVIAPAAIGSPQGSVPFGEKAYSPDGKIYAREIEPRDFGHIGIFEVCTDKLLEEIKVTQHPAGDYLILVRTKLKSGPKNEVKSPKQQKDKAEYATLKI